MYCYADMINYLTTATATTTYQPKTDMVNYVNTSRAQAINGLTTFGTLPECSNGNPLLDNRLVNKFYADRLPVHQTVSGKIYNYATKTYVDSNFLDRSNNLNQSINGVKTFSNQIYTEGIVMRDGLIWQDVLAPKANWFQSYVTGDVINFNSLFNLGRYAFKTRDSLSTETASFEITNPQTIVRNSLYAQGSNTFGSSTSNTQDIMGWLNLRFRTRIFDLNGLGNYTQMYMIGGNEFVVGPNSNGDKISFYCKDSVL